MNLLNKSVLSLTFSCFQFKPTIIPTAVTFITLCGLISLGTWQLERAEYKENIEQMIAQRMTQAPTDLGLIPADPQQQLYLPVALNGTYDRTKTLLLDNRVFNMQAGYNVYTALKLGNDRAILVDRGWVAIGKTRQDIPKIETENRDYYLEGILLDAPTTNVLGTEIKENYNHWPAVVQSINLKDIEKQLGYKLESKVLVLYEHSQSGFMRQKTPIIINMTSDRHVGYAVTWFLCAFVLFIIYLTVNIRRITKN